MHQRMYSIHLTWMWLCHCHRSHCPHVHRAFQLPGHLWWRKSCPCPGPTARWASLQSCFQSVNCSSLCLACAIQLLRQIYANACRSRWFHGRSINILGLSLEPEVGHKLSKFGTHISGTNAWRTRSQNITITLQPLLIRQIRYGAWN